MCSGSVNLPVEEQMLHENHPPTCQRQRPVYSQYNLSEFQKISHMDMQAVLSLCQKLVG